MNQRIFVTGIGTGVGKTVVAAIFTKALSADYWKPVQCGDLDASDSMEVKRLLAPASPTVHPEAICLRTPASPHFAAAHEGRQVSLAEVRFPATERHLIVEGAGGILVPLNSKEMIIDIAVHGHCKVVVVSSVYLGSLNHTFLTIEALRARKLEIIGLVFNGSLTPGLEDVIMERTGLPVLLTIDHHADLNPELISSYGEQLHKELIQYGLIAD
jgi:dethiobiotin synthetase